MICDLGLSLRAKICAVQAQLARRGDPRPTPRHPSRDAHALRGAWIRRQRQRVLRCDGGGHEAPAQVVVRPCERLGGQLGRGEGDQHLGPDARALWVARLHLYETDESSATLSGSVTVLVKYEPHVPSFQFSS